MGIAGRRKERRRESPRREGEGTAFGEEGAAALAVGSYWSRRGIEGDGERAGRTEKPMGFRFWG